MELEELIINFKENVNRFCIISYKDKDSKKKFVRRGVLNSVLDSGFISIKHITKEINWNFNLKEIEIISYTFEPIKRVDR